MVGITAEDIVTNTKQISSLPEIFTRIDAAINAPNSSFQYIGALVSEDVALSLRVLRVANSSFYAFPGKIDTIGRAMSVIGTKELRDIILATTIFDMFAKLDAPCVSMMDFWQHSIACAVAARVLATHRREVNPEMYYAAGILHEVGRLLIAAQCKDQYQEILERLNNHDQLVIEIEQEVLGFDHCTVGGLLVKRWKLGKFHQECIRYHCSPGDAREFPLGAATIHIAEIIVTALEIGDAASFCVRPMDEQAWAMLDIASEDLDSIIERIDEQFNDAAAIFLGDE